MIRASSSQSTRTTILFFVGIALVSAFVPMPRRKSHRFSQAELHLPFVITTQAPSIRTFSSSSSSVLYAAKHRKREYDSGEYDDDAMKRNKARTDIRNFLTQRTIQSFVFLLNQVRDDHTVRWIEKTVEFKRLDSFHGIGALDVDRFPSWDSLFMDLVDRPKEVIVVEVVNRRRRQHRGLSGGNNYLESLSANKEDTEIKDDEKEKKSSRKKSIKRDTSKKPLNPYLEDTTMEYEFDIDPASLVTRMIAVREQLANEWKSDLETLLNTNDEILVAYKNHQLQQRSEEEVDEDDDDDDDEEEDDDDEMVDDDDQETQDLTTPYTSNTEATESSRTFDRNAMVLLTNSFAMQDRDSSPFRQSNFDLLLLLSTQASIHRVLRQYTEEDSDKSMQTFEWLKDFYTERVSEYFDGNQQLGQADGFLQELMLSSPVVQETNNGIHLMDPMGMAEDIIRERSEVARQWRKIINEISEEHIGLQRLLLTRRMLDAVAESVGPVILEHTIVEEEKSVEESVDDLAEAGVFE